MSIRYFATNRDCENLGQDFNRDDRINLQKWKEWGQVFNLDIALTI
ncbi:MAG: hypothetical protein ACUZ8N_01235 [Candidatus Scalindua sp.]